MRGNFRLFFCEQKLNEENPREIVTIWSVRSMLTIEQALLFHVENAPAVLVGFIGRKEH